MTELVRLARPLRLVGIWSEVDFPTNYVLAAPVPMVGELFLFPSDEEQPTNKEPSNYSFDAFSEFHGRDGHFVSEVDIPQTWRHHDIATEILYLSRKKNGGGDGKLNRFRHRFARGTLIERARNGWVRIRGSGLYVSDRGIVN